MAAQIVLVHDEPEFAEAALAALRGAGYDAIAIMDSMSGIDALEHAKHIELLITRVGFRQGRPMARPWREWRGSSDRVSRFCSLRSQRFRSTPRASANSYRGHYPLTNCWRR